MIVPNPGVKFFIIPKLDTCEKFQSCGIFGKSFLILINVLKLKIQMENMNDFDNYMVYA